MESHRCPSPQTRHLDEPAFVGPRRRRVAYSLLSVTLAAIGGCTERDAVTAPEAIVPRFSQLSTDPVVNSLADPGDGTCDDAGTGDGCTLREAIALANPLGATITFDPALTSGGAQVITLDPARGQLVVSKNLTIVGPGADLLTVRRAAVAPTAFRIMEIQPDGASNVAVTIRGLTISGGRAEFAGAIANMVRGNSLTLSRVILAANTATGGPGGAVYNLGTLSIDRSTISGNNAWNLAGGIMALGGSLTITNSTISNNHADSEGGGIFHLGGTMALQNVTVSGNSAFSGGGISKQSNEGATLTHVTLAGNTATHFAGIYSLVTMPPITLSNTIVANNTGSSSSCGSSGTPTIADGGGNLVYPASSWCDGITPVTTNDPKLGALTLNTPGLTATMALGEGSAAIDAGLAAACTVHDQRGIARPQGAGCDIGAYELEPVPSADVTPPVITPSVSGTSGSNGWYRGNVTVSWSVDDAESAVTSTPCLPTTISADTPGQAVTCSATSAGGTELESVTIKRDATAPSLAPAVGPTPVLLKGTATATPNATDALSGVATSSCGTPTTATVGSKSVSCTATDNAGNSTTLSAAYVVGYQFVGFSGSVLGGGVLNVVKAGQNVPLKWRLLDAAGVPVTNLTTASVTVANLACAAGITAAGTVAAAAGGGGPALRNLGDGYYQYTWSTSKSYANTCKTMQLNIGEGTTHDALFRFTK
jgi:CSLREA domain-containing protein